MTDARFPERWLNDTRLTRLSGDAFKLFAFGLMFSVANRREGVLSGDDLEDIPRVDRSLASDLERAGLWKRQPGGWLIVDNAETQTSNAELDASARARQAARVKKANQRAAGRPPKGDQSDSESEAESDRAEEDDPNLLSPGTVASSGTAATRKGQIKPGYEVRDVPQPRNSAEQAWADVNVKPVGAGSEPSFGWLHERAAEHADGSR
jgi:hypothetical protein